MSKTRPPDSLTPRSNGSGRLRTRPGFGAAQATICIVGELREANPKKYTQKELAIIFGVTQRTVSTWLDTDTRNRSASKASKPDARTSVPKEQRPKVADRVKAGESQAQIAADLGISQQRVSQIAKQETAKSENKAKQNDCTEIKIHAERRVGEMLRDMPKKVNQNSGALTLREAGIDHNQSSRWQQLAAIPEDVYRLSGKTAASTTRVVIMRQRIKGDGGRIQPR